MTRGSSSIVRVLVVDDSAFARKVVRELLSGSPYIEVVGTARDGAEALELTKDLQPDLVTCDLHMPAVNGVEFVRRQMAVRPLPILLLTSAAADAAEVIEALQLGAIDFVQKPSAIASDQLRTIREELVEKVRAAARAPVEQLLAPARARGPLASLPAAGLRRVSIVLIGISTGGPQALRRILPLIPADFPVPVAIVLHMPVGYTAGFAAKLDELSAIEVKEAAEGDVLRPGRALLAQAGRHLLVRRNPAGELVAQLSYQPIEKLHRPSVDVLFESAAKVLGEGVLAVVMTGMGDDGKEGAAWVKSHGGTVLTEAERSCIIYGMPRSVAEAGLSDASVPLDEMVEAIAARI